MTKKKKVKKSSSAIILPSEKSIIAQRIYDYITFWYGPPGIGKTSFVDGLSDRTFFISTDRGTRFRNALREEVHNWKDLVAVVNALRTQEITKTYKLVCLDHCDDICNMAEDYACEQLEVEGLSDAGYNKGWRLYKKLISNLLQEILKLDVGLALIAHETITKIKTRVMEKDCLMPDLTKSAKKVILPKCDLVGYCGFKLIKKGGKKRSIRMVRTSPLDSCYAKDRTLREQPEDGWERLDAELFIETFNHTRKDSKNNGKKEKIHKKVHKKVKKSQRAR